MLWAHDWCDSLWPLSSVLWPHASTAEDHHQPHQQHLQCSQSRGADLHPHQGGQATGGTQEVSHTHPYHFEFTVVHWLDYDSWYVHLCIETSSLAVHRACWLSHPSRRSWLSVVACKELQNSQGCSQEELAATWRCRCPCNSCSSGAPEDTTEENHIWACQSKYSPAEVHHEWRKKNKA